MRRSANHVCPGRSANLATAPPLVLPASVHRPPHAWWPDLWVSLWTLGRPALRETPSLGGGGLWKLRPRGVPLPQPSLAGRPRAVSCGFLFHPTCRVSSSGAPRILTAPRGPRRRAWQPRSLPRLRGAVGVGGRGQAPAGVSGAQAAGSLPRIRVACGQSRAPDTCSQGGGRLRQHSLGESPRKEGRPGRVGAPGRCRPPGGKDNSPSELGAGGGPASPPKPSLTSHHATGCPGNAGGLPPALPRPLGPGSAPCPPEGSKPPGWGVPATLRSLHLGDPGCSDPYSHAADRPCAQAATRGLPLAQPVLPPHTRPLQTAAPGPAADGCRGEQARQSAGSEG